MGDLGVDGQREQAQDLAAGRADRRGPDQDPPLGVLDQLDEALVAGLVDPPPGRTRGSAAVPTRTCDPLLTGGLARSARPNRSRDR